MWNETYRPPFIDIQRPTLLRGSLGVLNSSSDTNSLAQYDDDLHPAPLLDDVTARGGADCFTKWNCEIVKLQKLKTKIITFCNTSWNQTRLFIVVASFRSNYTPKTQKTMSNQIKPNTMIKTITSKTGEIDANWSATFVRRSIRCTFVCCQPIWLRLRPIKKRCRCWRLNMSHFDTEAFAYQTPSVIGMS